jgi:hypothetical protein
MKIIVGRHKILFIGKKYTTSYNKDKKNWNCECPQMVIGHNHDEHPCKHVKMFREVVRSLLS